MFVFLPFTKHLISFYSGAMTAARCSPISLLKYAKQQLPTSNLHIKTLKYNEQAITFFQGIYYPTSKHHLL